MPVQHASMRAQTQKRKIGVQEEWLHREGLCLLPAGARPRRASLPRQALPPGPRPHPRRRAPPHLLAAPRRPHRRLQALVSTARHAANSMVSAFASHLGFDSRARSWCG